MARRPRPQMRWLRREGRVSRRTPPPCCAACLSTVCVRVHSFVALCENNRDAPLVEPPAAKADEPRVRTPGTDKDADMEDMMKNLKEFLLTLVLFPMLNLNKSKYVLLKSY